MHKIILRLKRIRDDAVGVFLGMLSSRHRFPAAMHISNVIGPLREMAAQLQRRPFRLGSGREYTLAYLLGCMDSRALEFTTAIGVTGMAEFHRAVAMKRGVLVVTTHANAGLARLILRPLADVQIEAVTISAGAGFPVCGAGVMSDTIAPRGAFLLAVRSKLRAGLVVCAMVDAPGAMTRTRRHVTADGGSTWLAGPLIRLAIRWHVPVAVLQASFMSDQVSLDLQILTDCHEDDVLRALSPAVLPNAPSEVSNGTFAPLRAHDALQSHAESIGGS